MEESSDQRADQAKSVENGEQVESKDESVPDLSTLKQINCQVGSGQTPDMSELQSSLPKDSNPSPSKTGTKLKRKQRSTRRRLNAMISNSSLHFSDTDSEGELTMISTQTRSQAISEETQQQPVISVTLEPSEEQNDNSKHPNCLSLDGMDRPRRGSFIDNLTDVDEIYTSEAENEQAEQRKSLTVSEGFLHGETDLEDLEADDEVQPTIYVQPRSDILCDLGGETIMTKEGDGPFSLETRNKLCREQESKDGACSITPDIVVHVNTDEEDMVISDEDDMQEACCSSKGILEELDILAASQIVMKNIDKSENNLTVKDPAEDADCLTDVEDVDLN